jgi:hypothetical protein
MSGSTGAPRIESRNEYESFVDSYSNFINDFENLVNITSVGSYKSNTSKESFGDIDLIVQVDNNSSKKQIKQKFISYIINKPKDTILPFISEKYQGKRYLQPGELVSIHYFDKNILKSCQIDNIFSLSSEETNFKQNFLNMTADKQGLLSGLIKSATNEEHYSSIIKRLEISVPNINEDTQEYDFSISSSSIELRLISNSENHMTHNTVWKSQNWKDVEKILEKYNLSWEFNDLISYCSINIKNERSKKRIKGIFNSLVTVKSGEINTEKGFSKLESIKKVNDIFNYE